MKWVWAFLILMAVGVGSFVIWIGFGEPAKFKSLRGSVSEQDPSHPRAELTEGTVLARFGRAPEFSLTERSGRSFSKQDLVGKPWLADFIFTSCAGQCPLMSLQMKRFQGLFGPKTGLRFVSFTVDPDRDTPGVLTQYADRYEAERDRWFFLTGPKPEINRILKEFFLSPVEEPAMHSIRFILVDGEGRIRGYYDSSDPASLNQLIHDTKILAGSEK